MDATNNCYDTLSYTSTSSFVVDGEQLGDVPGEYAR